MSNSSAAVSHKESLYCSLIGAFVFCIAAHGFAFLNFNPVHDGLNYVFSYAGKWEVSLGRFVQPLYRWIRGDYTMPWFSGMLMIVYSGIASFLVCDLLHIKQKWLIMLSAGFIVANVTMTEVNSSFIYLADTFALALLLSCLGVWFLYSVPEMGMVRFAPAVLCMTISMGLYQSYILVSVTLIVFRLMQQCLFEKHFLKKRFREWTGVFVTLLLTAVLYFGLYMLFMKVYQVSAPQNQYNSPTALQTIEFDEMISAIKRAYVSFAAFFFGLYQKQFSWFYLGNILMFAAAGCFCIYYVCKKKLLFFNAFVLLVCALLLPALTQLMSIIMKMRTTYWLTAHAVFLLYPGLLALYDHLQWNTENSKKRSVLCCKRMNAAVGVLCGIILFSSVRFSNEMYTFQRVRYDKTLTHVARIMTQIDATPGYEHKETQVVLVGELSDYLDNIPEPEGYRWLSGMEPAGTTYPMTFHSFVRLLGENMNILLNENAIRMYEKKEEIVNMPSYPKPGYCQLIDGKLIVKLSGD